MLSESINYVNDILRSGQSGRRVRRVGGVGCWQQLRRARTDRQSQLLLTDTFNDRVLRRVGCNFSRGGETRAIIALTSSRHSCESCLQPSEPGRLVICSAVSVHLAKRPRITHSRCTPHPTLLHTFLDVSDGKKITGDFELYKCDLYM